MSRQRSAMTIGVVRVSVVVCLACRIHYGGCETCAVSIVEPRDGAKIYNNETDPPFVATIALPPCPRSRRRSVSCDVIFTGQDAAFAPTFATVFGLQHHLRPMPVVIAHPTVRYTYQFTRKSTSVRAEPSS